MNLFPEIGVAGSLLLASAFLPQCYRLLSTKSAGDISSYYLFILIAGSFCFVVYGFGIRDLIVFLLNLYAMLANLELLVLKVYYDRKATGSPGHADAP